MVLPAAGQPAPRSAFRVGAWLVHPDRRCLESGDQAVSLEPRVMDVLVYLSDRPGVVVGSEQLLTDLWGGTFYGDSPVQKAMAMLRRALGDSASEPRYLETVRKRGYRLIAPVVRPDDYDGSIRRQRHDWPKGNPFVGLRPFDAQHASVFFGRSRATAELLTSIRRQRAAGQPFVLVAGPSGCGKTSLLQAGLIPLLQREQGFDEFKALSVASVDLAAGGDAVRLLAGGLCQWTVDGEPVFWSERRETLIDELIQRPEAAIERIDRAFERVRRRYDKGSVEPLLLLVLDHAESAASESAEDVRSSRFGAALAHLCRSPHLAIVMLCRSDLYPNLLARIPEIAPLKAGYGHFDLLPPSAGEIADIIRLPAEAASLAFERNPDTRLSLDDLLRDAAVGHPEALPMLQYTLHALYEECGSAGVLSFEAYERLGGLEGALAQQAERVHAALPATARAALPRVLSRLLLLGEGAQTLTSRRVPVGALSDAAERELVERLVDARLFATELIDGEPYFALAHDALLRVWPRIGRWLDDNRRRLQAYERLRQARQRWHDSERRADMLLSPGLQIEEARALRTQDPALLHADDLAFLAASEAAELRLRRRRAIALAVSLALAAISIVAGYAALIARGEAEQRQVQAESLIDYMLNDLAEQLRPLGRLQLMEDVAQQAARQLAQFPDSDLSPEMLTNRARALRATGEILLERGKTDEAGDAFGNAEAILLGVAADHPDMTSVLNERGTVAFWRGMLDYRQGRHDAAERHWLNYHESAQRLAALEPANTDWQIELSYALNNLGTLAQERGQLADAIAYFADSTQLKRAVLATDPGNESLAADLADSLAWLATTMDRSGQLSAAADMYQEQQAVLARLAAAHPSALVWSQRLALAQMSASLLQSSRGRLHDAAALLEQALDTLTRLVNAEPDNQSWVRDLAHAHQLRAWVFLLMTSHDRALAEFEQAQTRLAPLLETPSVPSDWRRLAATVDLQAARAQHALGRRDPALRATRAAADEIASLYADTPNLSIKLTLLAARFQLGEFERAAGRPDQARLQWQSGLQLLDDDPSQLNDRRFLELSAMLLSRLDRASEAARQLAQLQAMGVQLPHL